MNNCYFEAEQILALDNFIISMQKQILALAILSFDLERKGWAILLVRFYLRNIAQLKSAPEERPVCNIIRPTEFKRRRCDLLIA